jgi:hypothetical protein
MAKPGVGDGITEASVILQGHIGDPVGGDDLGTDGVVSEPLPLAHGDSIFGMTAYDRKMFGVLPHEIAIPIRDGDSEEWKKTDPGRFRQIQHKYGGNARHLRDEKGNPARPLLPGLSDQILVAVPREMYDAFEAQHEAETRAQIAESDPDHGGHGSFDSRNRDHIAQAAEDSHDLLEQIADENRYPMRLSQGIIGNTSGMSLEQALAIIPKDMREEEAKRYRQGARYAGLSDAEFAEAVTGQRAQPNKNAKSYGVGRGLGNENPNSALAQARNARAREQQGQRR